MSAEAVVQAPAPTFSQVVLALLRIAARGQAEVILREAGGPQHRSSARLGAPPYYSIPPAVLGVLEKSLSPWNVLVPSGAAVVIHKSFPLGVAASWPDPEQPARPFGHGARFPLVSIAAWEQSLSPSPTMVVHSLPAVFAVYALASPTPGGDTVGVPLVGCNVACQDEHRVTCSLLDEGRVFEAVELEGLR